MEPTVVVTGIAVDPMLGAVDAILALAYNSWAFLIPSTQFCVLEKHNEDNWKKWKPDWLSLEDKSDWLICHLIITYILSCMVAGVFIFSTIFKVVSISYPVFTECCFSTSKFVGSWTYLSPPPIARVWNMWIHTSMLLCTLTEWLLGKFNIILKTLCL